MAYRLWSADVKKGIVDFDDERYVLLARNVVNGKACGLVFDLKQCYFHVVINLEFKPCNAIDWDEGLICNSLEEAYPAYQKVLTRANSGI